MKKLFSNPAALAKYLLIILAAALDVFGVTAFIYVGSDSEVGLWYALYAFLMFIEAAVALVCAFGIKKNPRIYWLAVILVAANIIATIFDQFGAVDLLFVIFNAVILFVLLINRHEFLDSKIS
ncbi:MAG: hypothetical protein PHQ36_01880 [Anaerolineales bacterium]|nr:hypothetical protein [Anaerolineales bacterium]